MIAGKDFLTLAEIWINGVTEAEWRCAVSRAYYAAFHEARHLLWDLGFTVPLGDQAHAFGCDCRIAAISRFNWQVPT
jgi:hypothetical protein